MDLSIIIDFKSPSWQVKLLIVAQQVLDALMVSEQIDPYLLLLAFTDASQAKRLPMPVRQKLFTSSPGWQTNSRLILWGTQVLSLVTSTWLSTQNYSRDQNKRILNRALSPELLSCLLDGKGLAKGYFYGDYIDQNSGAQIYLALIGLINWYIQGKYGPGADSLKYIKQWLQYQSYFAMISNQIPCTFKGKIPPRSLLITTIPGTEEFLWTKRINFIYKVIKNKLTLPEMDPYLLLLVFTKTGTFPPTIEDYLYREYGNTNNKKFISLGDRIFHQIIISILMNDRYTPRQLSDIGQMMKSNIMLCELLREKELNKGYYQEEIKNIKDCGDIFRSLIGVIYLYFPRFNISNISPIEYIENWLIMNWNLRDRLKARYPIPTPVEKLPAISPSAGWELGMKTTATIIMDRLQLPGSLWENIDPYWIFIIFSSAPKSSQYSSNLRQYLINNYGTADYEKFELYGDLIMYTILTFRLVELNIPPTNVNNIVGKLTTNSLFECLMKKKDLCKAYFQKEELRGKRCADVFESLIGFLYWYLEETQDPSFNSLEYLNQWLDRVWSYDILIAQAIERRQVVC